MQHSDSLISSLFSRVFKLVICVVKREMFCKSSGFSGVLGNLESDGWLFLAKMCSFEKVLCVTYPKVYTILSFSGVYLYIGNKNLLVKWDGCKAETGYYEHESSLLEVLFFNRSVAEIDGVTFKVLVICFWLFFQIKLLLFYRIKVSVHQISILLCK